MAYAAPSAAQLKVMISGGFSSAYRQVLPEFEKTTGISVTTLSGASQGKGPQTIAAQLERGVPVDVVILSREGLTDLIASGRIVSGSDADLATVPIAAAVRAGAAKPDIRTVEGFKRALLSSRVIAVPASTSGIFLQEKVFPQLGVNPRNIKVTERGSETAALVARGEADIAVQPVSELMHVPGLEMLGRIPDEFQLIQMFSAAIVKGSKDAEAGKRLIHFLTSERASAAMEKNGMDPAGKRRP
jgi:molybdate transport system substrate-binding protein